MYSLVSVFTGSFMARIYDIHDHPNNWIIIIATLFCILPHFFIIHTLNRYKYTDNTSYASIKEYAIISIVIIIGWILFSIVSILDIHTLEFDFILAMSPLHMLYVLLMVQPDFFTRFMGSFRPAITRSILWCSLFVFVCLFVVLTVVQWLTIRPVWYAGYISVCFSTIISFFLLPLHMDGFRIKSLLKALWCGGLPRYQIAVVHVIMWEFVWFLLFGVQCHFGISILIGLLTGWVQLFLLLLRNKYFRRSAWHWNRRRRVTGQDQFSDDFHCRYPLEIQHLFGLHIESDDTEIWDL